MLKVVGAQAHQDMLKAPFYRAAQDLIDGKGYGLVPFTVSTEEIIDTVINPFHELILSPEEEKKKWTFDFSPNGRPDHGLVRRGDVKKGDLKHFLHERPWAPLDRDVQHLLVAVGIDIKPHQYWFACMEAFCRQALNTIIQVAEALDELASGLADDLGFAEALRVKAAMHQHVLRLLEYDAKPKANDLADAHFDYSFLTLAGVCETASGLWLGSPDNLYQAKSGWALVFPGRKMDFFTKGKIPATLHGVLSPSEEVRRNAAVFFSHTDNPMGLSYEEKLAAGLIEKLA